MTNNGRHQPLQRARRDREYEPLFPKNSIEDEIDRRGRSFFGGCGCFSFVIMLLLAYVFATLILKGLLN